MESLEKKLERIRQANWEWQKPYYQKQSQDAAIQLRLDPSVARGKFRPHPQDPKIHLAHPTTIRALKKNIILGGDDFLEFEEIRACGQCQKEEDQQFWHFCPHCESPWETQEKSGQNGSQL